MEQISKSSALRNKNKSKNDKTKDVFAENILLN
jgi:hypothetical protein